MMMQPKIWTFLVTIFISIVLEEESPRLKHKTFTYYPFRPTVTPNPAKTVKFANPVQVGALFRQLQSRTHISYLRPQSEHFIPAGMKCSISFRPEWSISFRPEWNGPFHSGQNGAFHSGRNGMTFFSFQPEWIGSFHSGWSEMTIPLWFHLFPI